MTSKARHVIKVNNAACSKCDRISIMLVCTEYGRLYCFPCLLEARPKDYRNVHGWVSDHPSTPKT